MAGKIKSQRKVLVSSNTALNLLNFRSGLIRGLVDADYEVVAVTPHDHLAAKLPELGCRHILLPMDNQGANPLCDMLWLCRFYRLLRAEKPDVVLLYTIKPNIYGSLAARALSIPVINTITGLGYVFLRGNWMTHVVRRLYRLALARSRRVFFQNDDDRRLFIDGGLVCDNVTDKLPGSGVDLSKYTFSAPTSANIAGKFRFLLIARMLWDKGVGEYVEAARQIRRSRPQAEFCLLGFMGVQNPAAISRKQMDKWMAENVVNYLGECEDVRPHLMAADCVVLPSYREGTPHSLLEAAAMGRPIITTDAVGCREAVDDGLNGLLCRVGDAENLAEKMEQMMDLSPEKRDRMGERAREKMEREFDEQIVIDAYRREIALILPTQKKHWASHDTHSIWASEDSDM